MSFPRYPKYKDSGVEWLGGVPEHWSVTLIKRYVTVKSGDMISATEETEEGFPVIGGNGLRARTNKWNSPGDTLVIGRVGAKCGCVHHLEEDFWASEHAFRVMEKQPLSKRFFFHLFTALELNKFAIKTAQPLLNTEIVETQWISVPPLPEQTTIATFLDQETAKIDTLVSEQKRLIELLKEKRQAVISHAVTKGLNPDVPMKDSGVEWLGAVPGHWDVKRLKHISPFITVGVVVNPSSFVADEGFPFIYGGDIREGVIDWANSRRIGEESSEANSKTRLKAGDLLTVRVGAPGITAVVPLECEGGNCASVMLVRQGSFNSYWLCYAMNTRIVRFQVEVVQYGAAQEQFNISHAVNFWTPIPPRAEQDKIAEFLACEAAKFDTLTTEAQHAIDLLQERRIALISAAVTGQIDVREIAKKEAS